MPFEKNKERTFLRLEYFLREVQRHRKIFYTEKLEKISKYKNEITSLEEQIKNFGVLAASLPDTPEQVSGSPGVASPPRKTPLWELEQSLRYYNFNLIEDEKRLQKFDITYNDGLISNLEKAIKQFENL
jgi:hypothetical protein